MPSVSEGLALNETAQPQRPPAPAGAPAPPRGWPKGPRLSVVVVEQAAALLPYVPAWEDLAAAALEPNVFYEPWLLLPAAAAFGAQLALRFVLVFAHGPAAPLLCGFFPLEC